MRVAGGLYEARDDDGQIGRSRLHGVTVDAKRIILIASLAQGIVKATVGVRIAGVVDLIEVEITKSTLNCPNIIIGDI